MVAIPPFFVPEQLLCKVIRYRNKSTIFMFKDLFIYLFLAITTIWGCKNDNLNDETTKTDLVGKWQLVSYCFSPGDASCPMQLVPNNQGQILEFTIDNQVIVTKNKHETELINCNGSFKKIDENQIEFSPSCEAGTKRTYFFSANSDGTATISPQCIEACKFNFVKK